MQKWWQRGVIYQIYPRSFQDTNGDGIGDLPGVIARLDYLQWLGIDAAWLSPIYPSPMHDFGYDVSDYTDVHEMFGNLADVDELIVEAQKRDIRIILDFVPNHSSIDHPWFQESRESQSNDKADWYIWRDAKPDGAMPNNWISVFGGESVWQWDEQRKQYYCHTFLKEQPDLNWRSPGLKAAMFDVMRFWFERGVAGLRVDAYRHAIYHPDLLDDPINPDWQVGMDPFEQVLLVNSSYEPDMAIWRGELRAVADEFDDRLLIGEIYEQIENLPRHYGPHGDHFHMPSNMMFIDAEWTAESVCALVERYESVLPAFAWPNWVQGNHDRSRVASRFGKAQARVAMMLLLTLRGTPTIYYGDELGMTDVPIPPEKQQDPFGKMVPDLPVGRDPERTPMQWDDTPYAGFSITEPWLPIAADFEQVNVAAGQLDDDSMLMFTKGLLGLRREMPALHGGSYQTISSDNGVFAFWREFEGEQIAVVVNMSNEQQRWPMPEALGNCDVLLRTGLELNVTVENMEMLLPGNAGIILKVTTPIDRYH